MKKIEIIRNNIQNLYKNKEYTFQFLREKLKDADIDADTLRKSLHRLHDQGEITIKKRGTFLREESFEIFLFIYGSLKKGFDNHHIIEKATYISKAMTVDKFAMYKNKKGDYPYLVKNEHIDNINGEVYKINRKDLLRKIDEFEDSPNYYQREKIKIKTRSGIKTAYTYFSNSNMKIKNQKSMNEWKHPEKFDFNSYFDYIMNGSVNHA